MPTDLHEQLAAELGTSPAEAELALHDLLHDVKERAEAGENVSLSQLGTFSMDEGTLHFTPSPPLQKAVNYRNNHLAPLTIRDASAPPDEPDPLMEEPPPLEDAPPADEASAPVEPSPEAPPPEAEVEPAEEPADEAPAADESEAVAALSENWTEDLEEEAPSQTPDETQDSTKIAAASTTQVAGLVASVVGLALLIWFVLGLQGVVTGPGALLGADEQTTPAGTDTVATASPAADTAASEPSPDTADAQAPSEAPTTTPPTIDRTDGGWTIVVASRTRPGEAKSTYESYQQRFVGSDVPVDILTGTSGGQVRYRIAVGQYASRDAALSAQQEMRNRLPDDAWILRVQPNS